MRKKATKIYTEWKIAKDRYLSFILQSPFSPWVLQRSVENSAFASSSASSLPSVSSPQPGFALKSEALYFPIFTFRFVSMRVRTFYLFLNLALERCTISASSSGIARKFRKLGRENLLFKMFLSSSSSWVGRMLSRLKWERWISASSLATLIFSREVGEIEREKKEKFESVKHLSCENTSDSPRLRHLVPLFARNLFEGRLLLQARAFRSVTNRCQWKAKTDPLEIIFIQWRLALSLENNSDRLPSYKKARR